MGKKLATILDIILAASRNALTLDFLLMEMAISSSVLMLNKDVVFFNFRFSQISPRPVARMMAQGSKKGSTAVSSDLRAFYSERFPS